jgi:hypothetical protein
MAETALVRARASPFGRAGRSGYNTLSKFGAANRVTIQQPMRGVHVIAAKEREALVAKTK